MNDLPAIPALMGVTTVARICAWCPSKGEADAWAIAHGHDISHGMCAECEAKVTAALDAADTRRFHTPSVRDDFGHIPVLDKAAKSELYLRYYGWKHACDGAPALPSVDDQARIVELVCNRGMSYADAARYFEFEKRQLPNTSLAEHRDESFRILALHRDGQLDAKESASLKSLDTDGNIY